MYSRQRVIELALGQLSDCSLDPLEQCCGHCLVVLDVLVDLDGTADDLGDTLALHLVVLHLGEVVVVGNDIGHDYAIIWLVDVDVLWLQEASDSELAIGDGECIVKILDWIGLGHLGIVRHQVWSVLVDQGVEGQTISPRGGEVADVDVLVVSCLDLAPEEEGVLGGALLAGLAGPCLLLGLLVGEWTVGAVGGSASTLAAVRYTDC